VPGLDALQLSNLNTHKIFYTVFLRTFICSFVSGKRWSKLSSELDIYKEKLLFEDLADFTVFFVLFQFLKTVIGLTKALLVRSKLSLIFTLTLCFSLGCFFF